MLSPVHAVPNASVTASQGTNAVVVAENLTRLTSSVALASDLEDQGAASAIKGKLSILLIAARERMIDSLFAAIDAAGKATSVTPLPGESRVNYAARVADKIVSLSPQNVVIVERQLSQQGQNVPLNVIAAALKNPGGSEAAAVITYLETARYKDRDLAARAVMRSYRQNDSSPFRPTAEIAVLARAVDTAEEPRGASLKPAVPALAQSPAAKSAVSSPILQDSRAVLGESVEGAETTAVDDKTIIEENVYPEKVADRTELAAEGPSFDTEKEPTIPQKWANVIETISEETAELLLAFIGDEDVQVLLDGLSSELPVELQAAITETIGDVVENLTEKKADPSNIGARQTGVPAATKQEPAALLNEARNVKLPSLSQAQIFAADPQQQAAILPKTAAGVGLISIPYDFDPDAPESSDTTPVYRTHATDQDGGGQPSGQQSRQEKHDQQTADDDQAEQAMSEPVADPIFALYRRMGGWE